MLRSRGTFLVVRGILALAAAVIALAGCVSHGAGTGTTGTPAGSGSVASCGYQGLSAVRHVWVIELECSGHQPRQRHRPHHHAHRRPAVEVQHSLASGIVNTDIDNQS